MSEAIPSLRQICLEHVCENLKNYSLTDLPEDLCSDMLRYLIETNQLSDWHMVQFLGPSRSRLVLPRSSHLRRSVMREIGFRCTNLRVLDLSGCKQLNNSSLNVILTNCAELRMLSLRNCYKISAKAFAATTASIQPPAPTAVPHIAPASREDEWAPEELPAYVPTSPLPKLLPLVTPTHSLLALRKLVLADCSQIDDAALGYICRLCPHLASLNVSHCKRITDSGVGTVLNRCTQLASLDLSFCVQITYRAFDPHFTPHIQSPRHRHHKTPIASPSRPRPPSALTTNTLTAAMDRLDLNHPGPHSTPTASATPTPTSTSTHAHTPARALRKLRLNRLEMVGDLGCELIALTCPRLELLSLRHTPVTERGIGSVIAACKRLTSLDLSNCSKVSDECFGMPLSSLRLLSISWTDRLTDRGLVTLADSAPHLTDLRLSRCHGITDEGLLTVLRQAVNLQSLDVSHSVKIQGTFLQDLEWSQNLHSLNMEGCVHVSLTRVLHALHAHTSPVILPKLRSLNLSATSVADTGLPWVILHCPRLRSLSLARLTLLSGLAMMQLLEMRHLRDLDLSLCPKLTSDQVMQFFTSRSLAAAHAHEHAQDHAGAPGEADPLPTLPTLGLNLEVLNVSGNNLSPEALQALLADLPNLSLLHAHHPSHHHSHNLPPSITPTHPTHSQPTSSPPMGPQQTPLPPPPLPSTAQPGPLFAVPEHPSAPRLAVPLQHRGDLCSTDESGNESSTTYLTHPLFNHPAVCLSASRCLRRIQRNGLSKRGDECDCDTDTPLHA